MPLTAPNLPDPRNLDDAREIIAAAREMIGQLVENAARQQQRIEDLESQVQELRTKAGTNSGNSSKSPSSDSAAQRAAKRAKDAARKKGKGSGKSQGAQPGHDKHERAAVPPEALDASHDYLPNATCGCGGNVVIDAEPRCRHQVFDLPEIRASVVEHCLYSGVCEGCGKRHAAQTPASVPSGQMGPGLIAYIALLSGRYHLSTRKIQALLIDQWGLRFSIGAISEAQGRANAALVRPYLDVGRHVRAEGVVHADETRHFRGPHMYWLWALATARAVYFMTHPSRGMLAADVLLADVAGIVVTDDYAGYNHLPAHRRQLCWAHLLRHFVAIGERTGRAGEIGRELELLTRILYRIRHRLIDGSIDDRVWKKRSERVRRRVHAALERGARLKGDECRTRAQCARLLEREPMLWTHLADPAIPLDNNLAERAIRPYVIWRKLSYAVQSHRGNQFRPMILTVVGTAERLGIGVHGYLRRICTEQMESGRVTTLLPLGGRCLPAA